MPVSYSSHVRSMASLQRVGLSQTLAVQFGAFPEFLREHPGAPSHLPAWLLIEYGLCDRLLFGKTSEFVLSLNIYVSL